MTQVFVRRTWFPALASFALLALGGCQPFSASPDDGSGGESGGGGTAGAQQGGASAGGSADADAGAEDAAGAAGAASGGTASGGDAGEGPGDGGKGGTSNAGAGGASGSGSACPCAAPTPTCEAGRCVVRGPKMVRTTSFYTDSTEVTVGQYAGFRKAKDDDTSGQAPECAWNKTYEPLFVQGQPGAQSNQPVTNVDFCDAAAFCAWADKQLCGKIGGGELTLPELADPTKSQWYLACAGQKSQAYPYGTTYQNGACNDGNSGPKALAPVAQYDKCEGYYPGLFDMLGNAQEWTGTCLQHTGEHDTCERIGGSYLGSNLCSTSGAAERNTQAAQLGFRCCSK